MNKIIIKGNITKDLDLKYTSTNVAVLKFSVAVSRSYTNASGEKETDFINCVAFKKNAENIQKYFTKGSGILICGRLETGSYDDKDGNKKYTTEVMVDEFDFIDKKGNTPKEEVKEEVDPFANVFDDFGKSIEIEDSFLD